MPDDQCGPLGVALGELLDGTHHAVPEHLPDVAADAARRLGWDVVIHLVDYEQRGLHPLAAASRPAGPALPIEGTAAGRAFAGVSPVVDDAVGAGDAGDAGDAEQAEDAEEAGVARGRVWVPLLDGVERLGVVRVDTGGPVDLQDPVLRRQLRWYVSLLGHLVSVMVPYGDLLDGVRRTQPRTVADELLWNLLPPLTFTCAGLTLAAVLEPCYEVAGDVVDYSVDERTAQLAVLDPVGHDLHSGLVAAVALAAFRTARRERSDLVGIVGAVEEALTGAFGVERMLATGVVAELDRDSGRLCYVNAGHPPPLVLRDGRVRGDLTGGRRLPLGLGDVDVAVGEDPVGRVQLHPGDVVVLYTDGVVEARDARGRPFGLDRFTAELERVAAERPPAPEVVRRVVHAVLDHHGGRLQDDATVLVAEWRGGGEADLWTA